MHGQIINLAMLPKISDFNICIYLKKYCEMHQSLKFTSSLSNFSSLIIFLLIAGGLSSCGSVKLEEMTMFNNIQAASADIGNFPTLTIQSDDILDIKVASQNPETVIAFQQINSSSSSRANLGNAGVGALGGQDGYRVDDEGNIYLPFIGKVEAGGKTLLELRQAITESLIQYIPDASIQVRFMNFRVTLMGEVNRPDVYTIPNERLTILEAIGMAGDFTPYAERDSVLIIRQRNDVREFVRINTQDKQLFESPYFFLSPNDIVYVEPLKAKQYITQGDVFQRYSFLFVPLVSFVTFFLGTTLNR